MNSIISNVRHRPSIAVLTSLRGIAAALIVVHHMGLLMLPLRSTVIGNALEKCGILGMSTFFVLSGFVIHYNYADRLSSQRERGALAFLFARFARLYPLYFAFIVLSYLWNAQFASHLGNQSLANIFAVSLPAYLAGMQSWFYAVINGSANLSISQEYANNAWSISAEALLYLFFIPLALGMSFKSHSTRRGIALTLVGMIGRILIIKFAESPIWHNWIENGWGAASSLDPESWLIYYSPYGRFFEFLAGMGIAEIWLARAHKPISVHEHIVMWILGAVALLYIFSAFFDGTVFSAPRLFAGNKIFSGYALTLPIVIYLLSRTKGRLNALMSTAPLLFVGEISYSLYLLHSWFYPVFFVSPGTVLANHVPMIVGRCIAFLLLTFATSALVYRFLEVPARKAVMKFYGNATTVSVAGPKAIDNNRNG